jgi:hypothetical protein
VEVVIPKKTIALSASQPAQQPIPSDASAEPLVDDELREWKRSRRNRFKIPWRQVSLMASLCFGIAFFALPDSVNSSVQWLLFALMGANFYAGVRKRREAKPQPIN